MKKILVTGAGGYIGSILVPLLLENKYDVIALDRFHFGKDKLPQDNPDLSLVQADIRSVSPTIFKNVFAVIDLAALSNDPLGELNPEKTWAINHLGRLRIASLAKSIGVERYIFPSSCSAYGFQEDEVDETSKTNPLTVYAKANHRAEGDVVALADNNFCVTVIRQATVYGLSPRMRFDLAINGMVKGFFKDNKIPVLRDGTQWRPFVHVKDTSAVMIKLLETGKEIINKELFNVGSNEQNYQILELAKKVAHSIGIPFDYEWYGLPDHRSYKVNFDKIRKAIGFKPEYDAAKGAKEIWQALQDKKLNPDDIQTITLEWYKKLIGEGVEV
jgi:nucleoside-diphosphate-sugar epimerase